MTKKVLVYGLGAIGGFYASLFSKNATVSVVARSNYEAVKDNGLKILSDFSSNQVIWPDKVLKEPDAGSYDFVVCCNKALDPEGLPDAIKASVVPGKTTIVIIQNGVGTEEPFVKKYPYNSVITCVAWTGAKQVEPGVIQQLTPDKISFGLYHGSKEQVKQFEEVLKDCSYEVCEDIMVTRWEKLVWNCAWNSLTALTMLNTEHWLDSCPEADWTTRALMKEVSAVAEKEGIKLSENLIDILIDKVKAYKGGVISSMMTDVQNGSPCEVEVILGNPMRMGRTHGIDTPVLNTLYSLLKAQNFRLTEVVSKGLPH